MATRRQPAPAASPAGFKIKLKTGSGGTKAVGKGNNNNQLPQEEGGDDVSSELGGSSPTVGSNSLKRKQPSSPALSPPLSKRLPPPREREESPVRLAANGEPFEVVPGKGETIVADLDVIKQRVGQPHASVGAVLQAEQAVLQVGGVEGDNNEEAKKVTSTPIPSLENISHGQLHAKPVVIDDHSSVLGVGKRVGADPSGYSKLLEVAAATKGVQASSAVTLNARKSDGGEKKQQQHTIPSHSGWFSWTRIHTLEKRNMPEFFNGKTPSKTPQLYMEIRNRIIRIYRENLEKIITVADVQEQCNGVDEKAISRVIEFLDHWGLINYQAPADFLPVWKAPAPALQADVAGMLQALPQKGSSLYNFNKPCAPVPKQSADRKSVDAVISEMLALSEGPEVEYHCNSCATDCSKQRYHCQKQADFDLCPDCYNDGKFGPDMVSTDFMRMDVTEAANENGGGWTDQETLLLLEALELYGENWTEIAEHVATKSKSQCILHFVRLPVEDPFLEDMETPGTCMIAPAPPLEPQTDSASSQGEKIGDETKEKKSPANNNISGTGAGAEIPNGVVVQSPSLIAFADAGNPVMAQVAFLAAMVGPRVAAAAAQAALVALTQKDAGNRLAAGNAIILEDRPIADVQVASSTPPQPDRLVQADAEPQSGDGVNSEATSTAGVTVPVSDSNAPKHDIGKDLVVKAPLDAKLNIFEEAIDAGKVRLAAASAMAAASVKAKLLANQEEREMQRLVTIVIENQLKKLELKLKTFTDLETMLAKECESVERARQKIYSDHARMVATRLGTSLSPNTSATTPTPSQPQQSTAVPPGQRPIGGYAFGPGGPSGPGGPGGPGSHSSPMPGTYPPKPSSSSQVPPSYAGPSSSANLQGPAGRVTTTSGGGGGAMSASQGQFARQTQQVVPPQNLGRPMMPPQGGAVASPQQSPQVVARSSAAPAGTNHPTRPLTAPPGMSRPMSGSTSGGTSQ